MTVEDDTPGVATSDEEGSVPEGATYPLNSKKLVVSLMTCRDIIIHDV